MVIDGGTLKQWLNFNKNNIFEFSLKIRQFNVSFSEFGWEMTKLSWKNFEKLLLSKKNFIFKLPKLSKHKLTLYFLK